MRYNSKCKTCKKKFYVKPFRLKKNKVRFCCRKCYLAGNGFKSVKEPRICLECQRSFNIVSSKRKRKFCSQACSARFSNKKRRGTKYDGQDSFRRILLNVCPHKCAICKYDKFVEAHHIVAKKFNGLNTFENGILLCPNHHREADEGMISIEELKTWKVALIGGKTV